MSAITITGGNATLNLNRTASTVNSSVVASVAAQVPKTSAAAPLLVKIVQNLSAVFAQILCCSCSCYWFSEEI